MPLFGYFFVYTCVYKRKNIVFIKKIMGLVGFLPTDRPIYTQSYPHLYTLVYTNFTPIKKSPYAMLGDFFVRCFLFLFSSDNVLRHIGGHIGIMTKFHGRAGAAL